MAVVDRVKIAPHNNATHAIDSSCSTCNDICFVLLIDTDNKRKGKPSIFHHKIVTSYKAPNISLKILSEMGANRRSC